jgi:hypothetical protein
LPLNVSSRLKRLFDYDREDIRQLTWQPYENVREFLTGAVSAYAEIGSLLLTLSMFIGILNADFREFVFTFTLGDLPVLGLIPGWGEVAFFPTLIITGLLVFAFTTVFGEALSSPREDLVDNARRGAWFLFASLAIYGAYGVNDAVLNVAVGTVGFFGIIAFFSLVWEVAR